MAGKSNIVPRYQSPPPGELGPAMKALAPAHAAFVTALMELGTLNHTRAALEAGYNDGPGLKVTAHRLAHDPRIQEAIREEGQRRLTATLPVAASVVAMILEDQRAAPSTRLRAAEVIFDRTGLHAKFEQSMTVTHSVSADDETARIYVLAKTLGLDPEAILGQAAKKVPVVVDAEIVEDAGRTGTEGLEDVL